MLDDVHPDMVVEAVVEVLPDVQWLPHVSSIPSALMSQNRQFPHTAGGEKQEE